ncbi:peptidoglycan DD-metalloendopeptidase family protein [Corynebacterium suicordis]|uniref:Peptidoglycan DD-metalloendopeptidase family protein n=1 Tax=Corynebacterium suicordis DSM 45110 TaxID=1121369 RepID=A0ABR9ZLT7_9CORY|nr:peptidoglycan DD-metalloendopeptidase family protein [Corynebacterium suicordis]MBF4554383.1 peptidoglycan DD-metalloendopeptidase family protein [Corynebacterium suicordis DSM 45110]MDR6278593.1 hypothetical protein [Corynebacterium suicordis]
MKNSSSMGKIVAALIAVIILLVTILVTFFAGVEEPQQCQAPGSTDAGGATPVVNGDFAEPIAESKSKQTSGYRSDGRPDHEGIDFAGPLGDKIYAFADGVVEQAGPASGFGNWIVIGHEIDGKHYSTVYGHMFDEGLKVKTGDKITKGQYIADEGYNGGVQPPGVQGAHLHFEVWDGGRFAGHSIDPGPWVEKARSGGGQQDKKPSDKPSESASPALPSARPSQGGELPDSDKILSEEHLQVDTIRVARSVAQRFPQVQTIGGWREYDAYPDHPSGRAADIMIPNSESAEGKKLGDSIKDYLFANKDAFHIEYMIWRQTYIPSDGAPNPMGDRGSPTQNHFDHVHVTTEGHGMPKPGQKYGPAPEGGNATVGATSGSSDCPTGSADGVDVALAEGNIPPEFIKWIRIGGRECKGYSAPLLAAQLQQESGFQKNVGSPAGANGPAQFIDGTWKTWGYKVDDQGRKTGAAGEGNINSEADATMAMARLMCDNIATAERKKASGEWKGETLQLALAAYNAGPGNVDNAGGVPPFAETQHYVEVIPASAKEFEAKV